MASNQSKRRRHRRSFGAIRQLASGNYQASFKALDGSNQAAPQTFKTREAADKYLAIKQAEQIAEKQAHALQALTTAAEDQPMHKVLAYLVAKQEALEPQEAGSVGSVGAITSYQFTTRQLQQHFNKSSWLAHSDNQAATLRGLLVQLSKDHWLQLIPRESTAQGGRPAEQWAVNPKAPESFRQLYA